MFDWDLEVEYFIFEYIPMRNQYHKPLVAVQCFLFHAASEDSRSSLSVNIL